jgi:protein involved in polysaccharide export with SLBB domain
VKKALFIAVCAGLMVSCASKRAAVVDFTIAEAKALQALAKAGNLTIPATDSIITAAEKQNDERQTEKAFVLADEAVLQLQISMLKQEQATLGTMKTEAENALAESKESLDIYRNVLQVRKNTPKEEIIN